jgi:hypothetical protein
MCERSRHWLLLIIKHKSCGIGTKNAVNHSVECGTYLKHRIFPRFILRTAVLFGYLQLKNCTFPANFNQCCTG